MSQTARGFGAICKTASKIRTQKLLAFVFAIAKLRGGFGGGLGFGFRVVGRGFGFRD